MDVNDRNGAKDAVDSRKSKSTELALSGGVGLVDFKLPQQEALVVAMPCVTASPESALDSLGGYGKVREAYHRAINESNVGDVTSLNCYLEPRPKGRYPSSANVLERESHDRRSGILVSTWSHPLIGEFKNTCGFVLHIAKNTGAPEEEYSCNILARTDKKVCFSGLADFRVTHQDRIRSWEEHWSDLKLLKSALGRDENLDVKTTWTEQSIDKVSIPPVLPVFSNTDIPAGLPVVQLEHQSSNVLTGFGAQPTEQALDMQPEEKLQEILQKIETKFSGLRQKDRSHIRERPSTLTTTDVVADPPRLTAQSLESSEKQFIGKGDNIRPYLENAADRSVEGNLESQEKEDLQADDVSVSQTDSAPPENHPKKKKRNISKAEKAGIIVQGMLSEDQEKEILARPSNTIRDWNTAPTSIKKILEAPLSGSVTVSSSDKHGEIIESFRKSFEERPIFSGLMLRLRLPDRFRKVDNGTFCYLAKNLADFVATGPWKRCYVRKGYDPWKDPDAFKWQSLEVRIPQQWIEKEEERTKEKSSAPAIENKTPSGKKKRDRTWGRLGSGKVTVKDPFCLSFVRSFMLFQVVDVMVQSNEMQTLINRPGALLSTPLDPSGWLHPYVLQIIRDAALYLIGEKKDLLELGKRSIGTFNLDMKFSEIDFNDPKFQDGWA